MVVGVYYIYHSRDGLVVFLLFSISVARTCNLILIVLDVLKPLVHKKLIEHELEGFGIRLNKQPPNIGFKKKDKGGINFTATVRLTQHKAPMQTSHNFYILKCHWKHPLILKAVLSWWYEWQRFQIQDV